MALMQPPFCEFGQSAFPFRLKNVDDRWLSLAELKGPHGTLIVFMCNHCPYVQGIIDRLIDTSWVLQQEGIQVIGIMSNDYQAYPDDAPEQMEKWSAQLQFPFPYLLDDTQAVARAYGAVCTPDFFGYNAQLQLQYRGRLDSSGKGPATPDTQTELLNAMRLIAETGHGPLEQTPSIGCSIKWKT